MRVTKPNWVEHTDEKDKKNPIFSLSVHPDGTRLATGGLDKKIKIWSTLPILDSDAQENVANHKLLCTMSAHTGSVLAVRWAHHGRFLATGSDDQVMMIWGIDQDGGGRVFGSDEVNHESWNALTRLVGHTADIIDIAWSRDDSMMASVGLDKMVWIWDGYSFERLRKLDLHSDFVKGVCWDPVGNFLATQSDDKTVKIWNAGDWSLVKSVEEPFKNSPKSTFFRRLSWSPDGAFIAASNAMNGPVFVAAVIEREGWNADISFVGHANTIQVAAFNPRLFFRSGDEPGRATASCMVALGADDFSISIWRNTMHKPMVVLHDIFSRPLLDLCWSNDGHHLYGCSGDGTICAISFDGKEFPELAAPAATQVVLDEYQYQAPKRVGPRPIIPHSAPPIANGFGAPHAPIGHVNVLQPRKGKPAAQLRRIDMSGSNANGRAATEDAFSAAPIQPFASPSRAQASTARMFQDAHAAFANGNRFNDANGNRFNDGEVGETSRAGTKRKASLLDGDSPRAPKGRMMASTQPRQVGEVREIRAPRGAIASGSGISGAGKTLPVPSIQTILRVKPRGVDSTIYLEAQNAEDLKGKNKITYCANGQDQWLHYLPSAVLAMAMSTAFCAVACVDGSVFAYTPAGRLLFNLKLESPCAEILARKDVLLTVTANCQIRVIASKSGKSLLSTSLSHLLDPPSSSAMPPPPIDLAKADLRPNGVPIITTTEPAAYIFDIGRSEWTCICSKWYIEGSPSMETRRGRAEPSGPLAEIESEVLEAWTGQPVADAEKPEWWNEAMEMGHLEIRMRAAELLGSKEEYRHWLVRYAVVLGKEGFRGRAEELVKELLGPIYHHPNRRESWTPTIVGLQKRELAKQVLSTLAQSTALSGLAQQYQGLLRSAAAEEGA